MKRPRRPKGTSQVKIDTSKDFYSVLQVSPAAGRAAIRQAYRRLSKLHHPGLSSSLSATRRKQEINEAYVVLSNPSLRSRYDLLRAAFYGPLAPGYEDSSGTSRPPRQAPVYRAPEPVPPAAERPPRGLRSLLRNLAGRVSPKLAGILMALIVVAVLSTQPG